MIDTYINSLMEQANKEGLLDQRNNIYVRNKILSLFQVKEFSSSHTDKIKASIPQLLDQMIDYALRSGVIQDTFDKKEMLKANIMDCFIGLPAAIEDTFYQKYEQSPQEATDYFYRLSQLTNYIQTEQIKKNIHFQTETDYGLLDITINLSKPEKSSEQIKRELEAKENEINYPTCVLCVENEGYEGRIGYPARANHRIIEVDLEDESWFLQYSPYIYYKEHSILLSKEHRDMKVTKKTFERLLAFVDQFPHYFIGSNADLPIVGGSILSHDHYQAGNYTFSMEKAEALFHFTLPNAPEVEASALRWPLSVIRLKGKDKNQLANLGHLIYEEWKEYSDEAVGIIASTNDERHNTVTPIARMNKGYFELDIVLRNNRTSAAFPDGIFHPHPDVQHIKKENIGLIEVMGLAVLPGRLLEELAEVKKYILHESNEIADYHLPWAKALQEKYKPTESIDRFIEKELGNKFIRILEDAGVYKQDNEGIAAYQRFIEEIRK